MQGWNEDRFESGEIGQALVLFEAADLGFAVADRDGKLELGEAFAAAKIFKQVAKSLK